MAKKWVSVTEYAKRIGKSSPQVVYNWMANGKLKEGRDWRKIKVMVTRKQVAYED